MGQPSLPFDAALESFWHECVGRARRLVGDDQPVVDLHVHAGIDAGDGSEMTLEAIDQQMRMAGVEHAVLIPLKASDGYHRTNLRLIERACESGGRLSALYRIDPRDRQLQKNLQQGLDAGAVGLKLHPRGDAFSVLEEPVQRACAAAAERRGVVLVHCGMDMDGASTDVVELARAHPDAVFVLGHVAADALARVALAAADLPNVLFCTAWWGAVDIALAMGWAHPTRIALGSDPPYGSMPLGLLITTHVARAVGYDERDLAGVLAGNAQRALGGRAAHEAAAASEGPEATGLDCNLLARVPLGFQRCYLSLHAAGGAIEQCGSAGDYLDLAANALESPVVGGREDAANAVREAIDLAKRAMQQQRKEDAFRVTSAALVMSATLPLIESS